jgi:hypothetical protein
MKKLFVMFVIFAMLAAGCGGTEEKPGDGKTPDANNGASKDQRPDKMDGLVLFKTPEGASFYVPEGWKSKVFKFPPTAPDLVRAGAETIFYPPDMDFSELEKKLAYDDFRYVEKVIFNEPILIYMQGATNRYMPGACKNYPQVTFYEGGNKDYESFEIPYDKETNTEACWATLTSPALKSEGEAFVFVAYGQRLASVSQPMSQFSGIALVGKSLSGSDRELFEKIAKSFRF